MFKQLAFPVLSAVFHGLKAYCKEIVVVRGNRQIIPDQAWQTTHHCYQRQFLKHSTSTNSPRLILYFGPEEYLWLY